MSEKSIYVFAKWQVKAGQLDTVLELLTEVAAKSIGEEGNLFYKAYQNNAAPDTLMLYEGYKDEAALNEHRNSEHFKTLVVEKIVPLLENREVILSSRLLIGAQ